MKWNRAVLLGLLAISAVVVLAGCTSESSRNVLTVVSVNGGHVYFSDLVSDSGAVVADAAKVSFGNIPNDGGTPLAVGSPFSEIVVTGYTVTYDNGIYAPVTGGLNVRIPSGGTTEATLALSDIGQKATLSPFLATSTIARISFTGYNRINGAGNGDLVHANANLTVEVANFKDADVAKQNAP
jgi:hypothetical protein